MTEIKTLKITLGTKEWADSNVNICFGCSNNCRYCYAKKMAIRFKKKTVNTWKIMEPNIKKINKRYGKRKGRVMFPTSHDITKEILESCLLVLTKLLKAGNETLITTKPCFHCVQKICEVLRPYRNLIQYRFTITSQDNELLRFWEPCAPSFEERFKALQHAFKRGYKTSISIEPFLDKDPFKLVQKLSPFVSESIWIGKMNYITSKGISDTERPFYEAIRKINNKENLTRIIQRARDFKDKVRIKDSILNYLNRK